MFESKLDYVYISHLFLPKLKSFGPVRSVDMIYDINTGRHKGFAFVEFETPEAANMAIQDMQAAIVGGRAVKVGRPSNMGQVRGKRLFCSYHFF